MTLSDGTTTLALPGGLQWTDRAWSPVVQSAQYCFGGQYVVQSAALLGGRPITLQSGQRSAYLSQAQRDQLRAWAAIAGQELTLADLRGEPDYVVCFRHQDQALELEPIDQDNDAHDATRWRGTIRLAVLRNAA